MARTPTIRDESILDAAREVFLAHGVGATTAAVAARAGISEGTIFSRFGTKEGLFSAAMLCPGAAMPWVASLKQRVGTSTVQKHLVELGLEIIAHFRTMMPIMMMAWSKRGDSPPRPMQVVPTSEGRRQPPPVAVIHKLAAYFQAEAARGRIRSVQPEVLARSYVGGLQSFVLFEVLLQARQMSTLKAEDFVKEHVGLLWTGMVPSTPVAVRKSKPARRNTLR